MANMIEVCPNAIVEKDLQFAQQTTCTVAFRHSVLEELEKPIQSTDQLVHQNAVH